MSKHPFTIEKRVIPVGRHSIRLLILRSKTQQEEKVPGILWVHGGGYQSGSAKTVFVTHLYENGRPDDRMWRIEHAKEVEKRIKLLDDSVNVIIPDWGSSYKL